jgi:phosphoglucosamine mutase
MKRLFGTDGIRGVAGQAPLDPPTVRMFGAALADVLVSGGAQQARVVLGRDTRQSGPWLSDAVAAGLGSCGASAVDAGVITTPGLAYAVKSGDFDAGVMISASHNPFQDNGLKTFGPTGFKLSDELEQQIEIQMLDRGRTDPGEGAVAQSDDGLLGKYIGLLENALSSSNRFAGSHLILDCANGSASAIAPGLFRHYGAKVESLGTSPDGRNINMDCGSLHLDRLAETVRQRGCDMGLAFDGDADRCLAVDGRGRIIDGDHILFIIGRSLKRRGKLRGDGLVATVMSNFWLQDRLGAEGITLHRASVGDKYVLERMLDKDLVLGGEQSGHVIFRDFATTGDGILTGLLLLSMLIDEEESLETIVDGIVPYPQVLLNVRVRDKPDLREHKEIGPVVREIEQELNDSGRVVLRYSGTEPLTRVMVEGKDADRVRKYAERLAGVIREAIGVS